MSAINPVALKLGYAGLVPFVIGALLSLVVREDAHPFVVLGLAAAISTVTSFIVWRIRPLTTCRTSSQLG